MSPNPGPTGCCDDDDTSQQKERETQDRRAKRRIENTTGDLSEDKWRGEAERALITPEDDRTGSGDQTIEESKVVRTK